MSTENISKTDDLNAKTTDDEFKKEFQTVGRPPVTDHDINEEGITDPPQNVPEGQTATGRGQKFPPVETEVDEYELEHGEEGPGEGRAKKIDVEKSLIHTSEATTGEVV